MFISELQNASFAAIPPKFIESVPETCCFCGYPIEISDSFTNLHCTNPRCPSKASERMLSMCQVLGIKDVGASKAAAFLEKFEGCSPLFIFGYNPDVHGSFGEGIGIEVSTRIYNQVQQKKKFTLAEYVKIAQLPDIQNSAVYLFGGYDDLEEAYKEIEDGGVDYIAGKLGIAKSGNDVSVRAMKVLTSLLQFKQELIDNLQYVEIIQTQAPDMVEITAVCSDQVGEPFKTKADFYAHINNISNRLHVTFLSAVNRNIDYLVWAGANGAPARETNKVKTVRNWNAQYEAKKAQGLLTANDKEIGIITGLDFMQLCLAKLKGV